MSYKNESQGFNKKILAIIIVSVIMISLVAGFIYKSPFNIREFKLNQDDYDGCVFFIPHQDDETLFYSQVIAHAVSVFGSDKVYVHLMSDGAASGAVNNPEIRTAIDDIISKTQEMVGTAFSDEDYQDAVLNMFVTARMNEFSAATQAMGVPQENISYSYLPDSKLPDHISEMESVMKRIEDGKNYCLFSLTPYYDPHPDHCALGQALYKLYLSDVDNYANRVFFIIKDDPENEQEFLSELGFLNRRTALQFSSDYSDVVQLAINEYHVEDYDIDSIAEELSKLVSQGNSLPDSVQKAESMDSFRLAVGPLSVGSLFEVLENHTANKDTVTILHEPFERNL